MISPITSTKHGSTAVGQQKPPGSHCQSKQASTPQADLNSALSGLPSATQNGALSGPTHNLGIQPRSSLTDLTGLAGTATNSTAAFAQVLAMLSSVVASFLNNKAPTAASAGTPAPAPATARSLAASAQSRNVTEDPNQKQRLDTTLAKIAQDPDGSKLLQAALAKGYKIEVGDPSQAGAQDAGPRDADSINGVTIPGSKTIIINPNAPNFDKTVVHELVHAATEGDNNSQTEEGMADVIGFRVSSRMDGLAEPGSEQQIFMNKIASYPNLNASNDIINSLEKLGIQP